VAISRLGFGCARVAGGVELRDSARLIEAAIESGIKHFDTAPSYGTEAVLGEVLSGFSGVTVATKVGVPRFSPVASTRNISPKILYRRALRPILGRFPALKSRLLRRFANASKQTAPVVSRTLDRDEILLELEQSLRLLRRTKLDLYLLHEPDSLEITDQAREVLESLKSEGVIGAFGLAFGAAPSAQKVSGNVEQCRYSAAALASPRGNAIRIYHGVLRSGADRQTSSGERVDAGTLMVSALNRNPDSAFIFSASSTRQIRQIARYLRMVDSS
jgi:aryl-alcohol dehydrogenase-like predicted oxidoreductase